MPRSTSRLSVVSILIAGLVLLTFASGAQAARKATKRVAKTKPSVTDLRFTLDDRTVNLGDDVTGTVRARSRSGRSWTAFAGATVSVYVGKVKVGEVTTDANGLAVVTYTPDAAGEYVMKVVYAGDSTHKPAKRARGFEVHSEFFADADLDGYGDAAVSEWALEQPEGHVEDATDCDDADTAVNPAATEVEANGIDDDCDGETDEVATTV